MENLKEEVINVISKLPDSADIDDIMYRLYVIDKIRKGDLHMGTFRIQPLLHLLQDL